MKNIQISEDLFIKLIKYHSCDMYDFGDEVKVELEKKLSAMAKRQYYTIYKTAAIAEEREIARLKYLDEIGVPKDFRW